MTAKLRSGRKISTSGKMGWRISDGEMHCVHFVGNARIPEVAPIQVVESELDLATALRMVARHNAGYGK